MVDTRPYIKFDDSGVCSACRSYEKRDKIDWDKRKKSFEELCCWIKNKDLANKYFDIVVPVSGGKDSIVQVKTAIAHGLRVLAVHVDYGLKTDIGLHNLNLIPKLGANLISYRPEEELNKKIVKIGLEDFGDTDIMNHILLYCFPLHVAKNFGIKYVMFGENPADLYVGDDIATRTITSEHFCKYVANNSYTAECFEYDYKIKLPEFYFYPFDSEVKVFFMSDYFHWDSVDNLKSAIESGFLCSTPEGTFRNYVGVDELINRIHQYFKYLKFGYGRATDHACEEIRNGRITREIGLELVEKYDGQEPSSRFLGPFLYWLDMKSEEFKEIVTKYRRTYE